jgi:hypothetical protein
MTGDLTVQGAFTSQGIDDNGNATALTIDSNENVLVGQTTNALADTGHILDSTGTAYHIRDGASPLILNRKSSDGSITEFYKDGTTVGSIQSRAGVVSTIILDPRSGSIGTGITGSGANLSPTNGSGAEVDARNDLGKSDYRFKDAYLSGGVYLGGTTAANKLEDFEEGTWTPNIVGSTSGGWTSRTGYTQGYYTKIGSYVHLDVRFETTSRNSPVGNMEITGLPFPAKADTSTIRNQYMVYTVFRGMNPTSDSMGHIALLQGGNSHFNIYQRRNNSAFSFDIQNVTTTPGNCEGHFHISYRTN